MKRGHGSSPEPITERSSKQQIDMERQGTSYDVFIIHSSEDNNDVFLVDKYLQESGFKTCLADRDFVPGRDIFTNIETAIRESRKYLFMISDNFNYSSWCKFEASTTVSLLLDKRKSRAIIPLLLRDDVKLPSSLIPYETIYFSRDGWKEKLNAAMKAPFILEEIEIKPFKLVEGKEFHVLSVSHSESEVNDSPVVKYLKVLEDKGFKVQHVYIAKSDVTDIQSVSENTWRWNIHDSEDSMSTLNVLGKLRDAMNKSAKVVLWLGQGFQQDGTLCTDLIKSLVMSASDKQHSPAILPVLLDGYKPPDWIKHITYQSFGSDERFTERFLKTVARTDMMEFPSKQEFRICEGATVCRISEFEGKFEDDRCLPRYLDIHVEKCGNILLLDADNECLKKCTILGRPLQKLQFEYMPNRLSTIDPTHVALLYRDNTKIVIINTQRMEIEETRTIQDDKMILKGITALSRDHMLVTYRGTMSTRLALVEKDRILHTIGTDEEECLFGMPRRLTTLRENLVVMADEDDRRLILVEIQMDDDGGLLRQLKVLYSMRRWNNKLFNVRAIAGDSQTESVYVAACNGITMFDVKTRTLSEHPLVVFPCDIFHTRALSFFSTNEWRLLAVSQAKEGTEVIRVFAIHH